MRRWRVYLLHITWPNGDTAHYVGIAKRRRLLRRLREHVNGYGTPTTARHIAAGATLRLARTWLTDDAALEARIAKAAPKGGLCPICVGRSRYRAYPINRDPTPGCHSRADRAEDFLSFSHDRCEPQKQRCKGQSLQGVL